MTSFQNPWPEPGAPSFPESPLPTNPPPSENPVWNGWDVLQIALLTVASIVVFLLLSAVGAKRLLYPRSAFVDILQFPLVTVLAQLLAYALVLGFMVAVVKRVPGHEFWRELRWNWPSNWPLFLVAGFVMSVGLQAFAHLLPMPKELPIDRFFRTAQEAWALSLFGMTFAPLMEELFFRGFLYPVLARRLGTGAAIILTSVIFGLIHAPQLGRAWGPVLVVFLVGLALTITRAATKSVAPGFLMHVAYNSTISILLFAGTGGFRHLERLSQ
ncbi:MAG TPA: type II CAAX endopeptidase family protein [Terriglobales bacterium]|nr:type II CAAX endopeptidase family protein [Terriglobales bacterium]